MSQLAGRPPGQLSARGKFHLVMATMALMALVVIASSLTQDAPHVGGFEEHAIQTESMKAYILEVLEGPDAGIGADQSELVEPLPELEEAQMDVPDAAAQESTAALDRMGAELDGLMPNAGDGSPASMGLVGAPDDGPAPAAAAAPVDPASAQAAAAGGDPTQSPAVVKALKDAAEAKVQAMQAQQKALQAGSDAKAAAAEAAQAPMTQAGQQVVLQAQQKVAAAKLAVDTAKAAVSRLNRMKEEASKAIIDAAGGKYAKQTGYAGQGGYFGTALRTAFKNGELTEQLKHEEWKKTKLKDIKKQAYEEGLKKGEQKGEKEGEAVGKKEELPKAVAKAEKMLSEKKSAEKKQVAEAKTSAQDAALKNEAAAEVAKVTNDVDSEAKKDADATPEAATTKALDAAATPSGAVDDVLEEAEDEDDDDVDAMVADQVKQFESYEEE